MGGEAARAGPLKPHHAGCNARTSGRHRVRLLVKAAKGVALQGAIARWIAPLTLKGEMRLAVDIDPQSFY